MFMYLVVHLRAFLGRKDLLVRNYPVSGGGVFIGQTNTKMGSSDVLFASFVYFLQCRGIIDVIP